ncbi:hypothetical protein ES705_44625 [subsurface metagenome]
MPKKEPLYPHVPKSRKLSNVESEIERAKRKYTPAELAEMAKIFYEVQMGRRATIYAWTPMYTRWENLAQSQRDEATRGLQERIERESLTGYLERKRPLVGDVLTKEIISELKRKGYL